MQTQWIYQQKEEDTTYRNQYLTFDKSTNPNNCITYIVRSSTDSEQVKEAFVFIPIEDKTLAFFFSTFNFNSELVSIV